MDANPQIKVTAKAVAISFAVHHPQSDTSEANQSLWPDPSTGREMPLQEYHERYADADGQFITWGSTQMTECQLAGVVFRHGIDPRYAARLLRKLAAILDANPMLVNQPDGSFGEIRDGRARRLKNDFSGYEPIA